MKYQKPLIIQSDMTIMLDVGHPDYIECRDFLAVFAELIKSPDYIHTYKLTPLSMWNAAALDYPLKDIINGLENYSQHSLPENLRKSIAEWHQIYGKLILQKADDGNLELIIKDENVFERIKENNSLKKFWKNNNGDRRLLVSNCMRGELKHELILNNYPVKDICGYIHGDAMDIDLETTESFQLRDYQKEAIDMFYLSGSKTGGSGVIVLPCGSGKTIIGIGAMAEISNHTLIIATNNISVSQWRDEILARSSIKPFQIGEWTGRRKEIKPITITTYQMLIHRVSKYDEMKNLNLFTKYNWGFIIYDEVHMLPAPVFRATTEIQARRRLGLTATLIREDGKEDHVFALIGPKRYDVPWKTLENKGYIAQAFCTEFRLSLSPEEEYKYAHANKRAKFRIASENQRKFDLVEELLSHHEDGRIMIIGQYISQLEKLSKKLDIPIITGKTNNKDRELLYKSFREGKTRTIIVSKIANFAVDIPDANIMIQISGTFGSRQEEAQRLGRILRPKNRNALFYTLVSKSTVEQEFANNRQLFLVEQGYKYNIRYF